MKNVSAWRSVGSDLALLTGLTAETAQALVSLWAAGPRDTGVPFHAWSSLRTLLSLDTVHALGDTDVETSTCCP